jgi:glutamate synthase (ferredoxin)
MGLWILGIVVAFFAVVAIHDVLQRKHAILRNFPVIGHLRYMLEALGPELRQYIVNDNDSERPFSRDERRWVYASAKKENNYFGFGTDNSIDQLPNYLVIKHATFPFPEGERDPNELPAIECAKVWGGARGRAKAFRPKTTVYVSAMSFGSLSGNAVQALNHGAAMAGCLHNTGEGSITDHHDHGGELLWQIGTGYFGCRDEKGRFSLPRLVERVQRYPVRALEIKLSQGAKPGHGGVLPAAKITPEIAAVRGIPMGRDCISPAGHSAFSSADELLDFAESLAEATGLPVGIKSAVGEMAFWHDLAKLMESGQRGVDFITIDGGEGGTGAAPLAFADHVSFPFKTAFPRVYRIFAERGLTDRVVFNGSGRLGFPQSALFAHAMGCDSIAVAREAMLSIGCIQAQRCHTGHCPAGVATQSKWLMRGLDPTLKSARFANYVATLQSEIMDLTRACGLPHPALVTLDHFDVLDEKLGSHSTRELFGYQPEWGLPPQAERDRIWEKATGQAPGIERSAAE